MASSSSSGYREVNPGPINRAVLHLQEVHISEHIWNNEVNRLLRIRRATCFSNRPNDQEVIPPQIVGRLERAGFLGVAQLAFFEVESALISALVERWRPETHTFHMLQGECTITLEDIGILTGLPIEGDPIIGSTSGDFCLEFVEPLLGIPTPSGNNLQGSSMKMSYLDGFFNNVDVGQLDEIQLDRYARAFILRLLGGLMFCDHSSSRVPLRYLPFLIDLDQCGQYSWGSAVLGYLYHELCLATNVARKDFCGMGILVQLWAWERFVKIKPSVPTMPIPGRPYGARWPRQCYLNRTRNLVFYRRIFDTLDRDGIVWMPYPPHVMAMLPHACLAGQQSWRAIVPLICFQYVEWHQPDRVMRQFGMQQHIPSAPQQDERLHDISLKGKAGENWMNIHMQYIQIWHSRHQRVIHGPPQHGHLSVNSEYMQWFVRHTRLWIDKEEAIRGRMMDKLEGIHYHGSEVGQLATQWPANYTLQEVTADVGNVMAMGGSLDRISMPHVPAATPLDQPQHVDLNLTMPQNRVELGGLQRRRQRVQRQNITYNAPPQRQEGLYYVPSQTDPTWPPQSYTYPPQHMYTQPTTQSTNPGGPSVVFEQPLGSMQGGDIPSFDLFSSPYVPSPPVESPSFVDTPPAYQQMMSTPGAPPMWNQRMNENTVASAADTAQGLDLNSVFDAEVDPVQPRRNPARDARNRRRRCILTPQDHSEEH